MTDLESPSFYAILTADVRYDKSIPANAKLLFAEITALANKEGYCFASNNYFARLYEVTPQAISKWVNLLQKAGYIIIDYIRDGKEIKERHIFVGNKSKNVSTNNSEVSTNIDEGINKGLMGYQQKIKDNITNNNKLNNTLNTPTISDYEERITLLEKQLEEEKTRNEANASSSKKSKKSKKNDYTPLLSDDFYKLVFAEYKRVFFGLNNGGIPNAKDYKQNTDKAIVRLRELGMTDDDICSKIFEAIHNAPSLEYWRNTAKGSFAYIVSEAGMNHLTGKTTASSNKGSAISQLGGYDANSFEEFKF